MPEKLSTQPQGETFANEESLPSLSVPSLKSTLDQLKESMAPMLNEEDYKYLEERIDEFVFSSSTSTLQNHLHKFQQNEACYLDHLNFDHILIGHHALPRNPFLVLENDPLKNYILPQNQTTRAAVLTTSTLKFITSLRLGVLKPDKSRSGRPLTMKPYLNLFGTTRYPESDTIKVRSFENTKHILILSNSLFFTLEVLTDANELVFNADELSKILDEVVDISSKSNKLKNFGSITSDSYKSWKHGRSMLSEAYRENMTAIDSALFALVLDHSSPDETSNEDIAKTVSVGTLEINEKGIQVGSCNSRWYDKLQLIVTKNAIAGVCWDSYSQDGSTILRLTSDIYADSVLRLAEGDNYTLFPYVKTAKFADQPKPSLERLHWEVRPEIATFLHLAETRLTDLICSHSTNTSTLKYGRAFAKKIGIKADSLIQVSLQIAHYALYGKPLSTVEPVTTRFFRNARSEYSPIQHESILKACQIFVSDSSNQTRWEAFLSGCQHHSDLLKASSSGLGFVNHLRALQSVFLQRKIFNQVSPEFTINGDEPPPLLFDNILTPLFVPDLIASNCGNPAMKIFGITPAVDNGFGVGYIVKDDETKICLISEYRQGERLLSTLEWVIRQIHHIWRTEIHRDSIIPHAHILDNQKKEGSPLKDEVVASQVMARGTRSYSIQSEEEDVDLALGGYGYFDIDNLTIRSVQQSRAATPLHSTANSTTNLLSQFNLQQQSQKNQAIKEDGQKLLHFEKIKDTFESHNNNNSSGSLDQTKKEDENNKKKSKQNYNIKFDRAAVGKKVEIDDQMSEKI